MALLVEVGFGSTLRTPVPDIVWTDITSRVDVAEVGISITRGAQDERSRVQPGTATMMLDNSDGALSPGVATSPHYPHVRKGVPIRAARTTAPARTGAAPYPLAMLCDDFDDGVIDPVLWPNSYGTGLAEADGRARVPVGPGLFAAYQSAREWTLAGSQLSIKLARVPAVGGSSAASASLMVNSTTDGTRLGFTYSPVAGTLRLVNETAYFDAGATTLTYSPAAHAWLRLREAAGTLVWETSGDGHNWTVRRTLATPAWVTAQAVVVELVANRTGGVGDFVEWDLVGHRVHSRFWGKVNDWPTKWKGLYATARITCSDLFAFLSQQPQLRSCLDEEILDDGPIAYYPLTEDSGALTAGDLSGVTAGALSIVQQGVSGGVLDFGAGPGPAATGEQYPLFTPVGASQGKYLASDLGQEYERLSTGQFNALEFWFTSSTGSGRVILALESPDQQYQLAFALSAGGVLQAESTLTGDTPSVSLSNSGNLANGLQHHVVYDEFSGNLWVDGVSRTLPFLGYMYGLRLMTVGAYHNGRLWSGTVSSIALYTTAGARGPALIDHYTAGMTAFAGEDADTRIGRLARYGGVDSVTVFGSVHDPVASQGTGGSTALSMMQAVEDTDSGRLYAERDWLGLAYQSRDVRYNPDPTSEVFTISYADLITDDVERADDDQKQVNTLIVTRPAGARQRVIDQASIDLYGPKDPGEMSLLKTTDNAALDAAHWIISRYADPPPELREIPVDALPLSQFEDILDGEISEFFTITDLPAEADAPEQRVTIEGYSETLKDFEHLIKFHTSRAANDSVWVLDDAVYSVLDSTTRLAY